MPRAFLLITLLVGIPVVSGCSKGDSTPATKSAGGKASTQASAPGRGREDGNYPASQPAAFRMPWNHGSIVELAKVFRERVGADLENAYGEIPPGHMARLRSEYEAHRGAAETPFDKLSKMEIASLYMAVQPFWRAETWKQEDEPWKPCLAHTLSDGTMISVAFRQAHPFLAEYDRKVIVAPPTGPSVELAMPMNVGGRTKMNVYFYPQEDGAGPFIRFQDQWGETLLDLPRRVLRMMLRIEGIAYAGDLRGDASAGWSILEGGEPSVRIGGRPAERLTGRLAAPGQYLGRLDGTKGPVVFIAASAEKEMPIPLVVPR